MGLLSGTSIKNRQIHFDQPLYFGGDVVRATVSFTLTSAVPVKALRIEWSGKERSWKSTQQMSGSDMHTEYSSGKRNSFLCHQAIPASCWGGAAAANRPNDAEEEHLMPAGEYRFPIAFALPAVLPPSWEAHGHGGAISIRYEARVVFAVCGAPDSVLEGPFQVGTRIGRLQLQSLYTAPHPDVKPPARLSMERTETLDGRSGCCSCFSSEAEHQVVLRTSIAVRSACVVLRDRTADGQGDAAGFDVTVRVANVGKGTKGVSHVEVRLTHGGYFSTSSATGYVPQVTVRSVRLPLAVAAGEHSEAELRIPLSRLDVQQLPCIAPSGVFNSSLAGNDWRLMVYAVLDGSADALERPVVGLEVFVVDEVVEDCNDNSQQPVVTRISEWMPPNECPNIVDPQTACYDVARSILRGSDTVVGNNVLPMNLH